MSENLETELNSEELHRAILNSITDAIFVTDDQGNLTYTCINASSIFGYSPEEIIARRSITDFLGSTVAAPELVHQQGLIQNVEVEILDKLAQPHTLLVNLKSVSIQAGTILYVCRDISDRKQVEATEHEQRLLAEALRDSLEALTSAVQPDQVLARILDAVEQLVPSDAANIQLLQEGRLKVIYHRGYHDPALLETHFGRPEYASVRHMMETRQPFLVTDTTGNPAWRLTPGFEWVRSYLGMPLMMRDKTIGFLNLDSSIPDFFTQKHADWLAAFADQVALALNNAMIHEEQRRYTEQLEERVAERTTELESALQREKELNQLKSRFVTMISHEFRTPLTAILSSSEMIRNYRERMDAMTMERKLDLIHDSVMHMTSLLNDALAIGQFDAESVSLQPITTDLVALCELFINDLAVRAGRRIEADLDEQCRNITADPRLFQKILDSLLDNAIIYSAEDTPINVRLRCLPDEILLQVQDQGIGIPEKDRERLFEAFHRGTNVGTISGTGLGLAIAQRAVTLHSGSIELESVVKQGTTFTVHLPRPQDSAE